MKSNRFYKYSDATFSYSVIHLHRFLYKVEIISKQKENDIDKDMHCVFGRP